MDGMDEKLQQRFDSIMEMQKALANRKQKTLYEMVLERIQLYIVPFRQHIITTIPESKIKAFHIAGGLWLHIFQDKVTWPYDIKKVFYEFAGKGQEPKIVNFKEVFKKYEREIFQNFGQAVDAFMENIESSMKTELAALPTDEQLQEKRITTIRQLHLRYQGLADYYSRMIAAEVETVASKPDDPEPVTLKALPSKGTTRK